MNILIINAGSSSLKYQLMDPETGVVSAKGLCERIGIDGRLNHKFGDKKDVKDIPMPTHTEAKGVAKGRQKGDTACGEAFRGGQGGGNR